MSHKNKYNVKALSAPEVIGVDLDAKEEKAVSTTIEQSVPSNNEVKPDVDIDSTLIVEKVEDSSEIKVTANDTKHTEEPLPAPTTIPSADPKPQEHLVVVKDNATQVVNKRVLTFNFQCKQYIAICKYKILSEEMLTRKLYQFANIIRMIINTTDTEVYDAAYTFFREYRNSILSEDTVFAYIHKIPTEQSIRMQTIYTTFREMVDANVNKHPFALDYGLIRDNLKLPAQHPLLAWIRRKLGNNK